MPLLKSYEQKQHVGSKSRVLLMSSAPSTTEGVGTPPKPALRLLLGPAPILTPMRNELTPLQGRSKGTCCLFLLPPAAVEAPVKLCLNFLSGLQSISIDQGGQEPWCVTITQQAEKGRAQNERDNGFKASAPLASGARLFLPQRAITTDPISPAPPGERHPAGGPLLSGIWMGMQESGLLSKPLQNQHILKTIKVRTQH